MTGPPLVAGPHAPATSTLPRSPGSVRRTTSIDTVRPDGPGGALLVDARGRDLLTRHDGSNAAEVVDEVRDTGRLATPHGPAAPTLTSLDGDPHCWHAMAPLPPDSTRRRRRLDVLAPGPGGLHAIDAHFRDTHVDGGGQQTVVHEYAVHGFVDARHRRIVELSAEALVLPRVECPAAVAGAERLQGTTFDDVRRRVRDELVGTASCTHLNDTLRSLADLEALLRPRAAR